MSKSKNSNKDEMNIGQEHFKYILLPNIENKEVLNIFLFYREENFVTEQEFHDFLNKLNLKDMIYKLFAIPNEINLNNCKYLNNLQRDIIKFNYDNFKEEEQQELKWLLYDCLNSNGNEIVDSSLREKFISKHSELNVYFTDMKFQNSILNKLKKYTLGFYENENKTIKYLKFINRKNYNSYDIFHQFILMQGKKGQYAKEKSNIIDHIQKPPSYFYDYNCSSNIKNICEKKPKTLNYESKEYKQYVKNLIYCRIIESWKITNRLIENKRRPQFNNCYYNLKELNETVNRDIKAEIIDKSDIIYPHTYKREKNKMYIDFYFPKSQKLKTTTGFENVVFLSIIYNLEEKSYTDIIKELHSSIFKDNTISNYDENIDYNKLFKYIKGKDILYMVEYTNNVNQRGILNTKDVFYDTKELVKIKNYQ